MSPIPPVLVNWIALETFIKKALTGQIMIDADHIGGARMVKEPMQFSFSKTVSAQIAPHEVMRIYFAAQQVKGEPTPLILELSLIGECWCAECLAQIIGLHQLGPGIHT